MLPMQYAYAIECHDLLPTLYNHCRAHSAIDPVYRREAMPSRLPVLLILEFSPILLLRLVPTRLLCCAAEGRLPGIELMTGFRCLNPGAHGNRLIPSESLTHIHHPTLTVSEPLLQLLALRGHLVNERMAEAIGRLVPLYHYTV